MSTPNTSINVARVGFSNDYQHVVYFNSSSEQFTYFINRATKAFTQYVQIRKNTSVKVNAIMREAERWNYATIAQNNKYYYYFITDVKYISDETVELILELDVMQTYMFNYTLKPCLVEREHTASDEIGENTIEEGLEVGKLISNQQSLAETFWNQCVLIMSTVDLTDNNFPMVTGGVYDHIYSGCSIYRVKGGSDGEAKLKNLLTRLNNAGKLDAIVTMWQYPESLVKVADGEEDEPIAQAVSSQATSDDFTANRPSSLDGYKPRNNKLFTYPFTYLYAYNNMGNSAIYRYEQFYAGYEFSIMGSLFPDGGIMITPKNYYGTGFNYDESLRLTGFPTCAWTADTYKIWLAQNQNQQAVAIGGSIATTVAGGAMAVGGLFTANPMLAGSGVATMAGGVMSAFNLYAQQSDMERQPPQSRGGCSSTLNSSNGVMGIFFQQKTLTAERARIIDDFFTMYGYKVLQVKVPNRAVRESFTYTKTVNCYIVGDMGQEDIRKIQSIYDNGVTFWKSTAVIGDYSASNATIGGD